MNISIEQAREYIQKLDLRYIVDSMCAESYPLPRWTESDAKQCCELYKNFLFLMKKHVNESLVPSRQIDEFWHNHILYTRNYTHDCLQIFGHYLHHVPSSPTENPKELADNYLRTKTLYLAEFNKPIN